MTQSLERRLRITIIRDTARKMVFDLGECNDYRIMFCASAVGRIGNMALMLEELTDFDLVALYRWIVEESRFDSYA